jgi:diaminopimelate decarboxylase
MMDVYKSGIKNRFICGADTVKIAERYGTPLYIFFEEILHNNYQQFKIALDKCYPNHLICYAVKANTTFAVIKLLADLGSGADVASEYELKIALDAGISKELIRANGNCKSEIYLRECISRGIIINVDPEGELEIIDDLSRDMGMETRINLRLAGFPLRNITSSAITTSSEWSKFGIDIKRAADVFKKVQSLDCLVPNGLMVHLGSQITDVNAYHLVLNEVIKLAWLAKDAGIGIDEIDLGGGYPISYLEKDEWELIKRRIANTDHQTFTWGNEIIGYNRDMEWASEELYSPLDASGFVKSILSKGYSGSELFKDKLKDLGSPRLVIEPGRSLVGSAQVTIAKVCNVGRTPRGHDLVHVNAGVNHHSISMLIPEQIHKMEVANKIDSKDGFEAFVAGNLCFTGDLLCKILGRLNTKPTRGDYLMLYDTGAYTDFFSSNTNSFPRPARVLVDIDGRDRLVVEKEDFEDIFQRDSDWMRSKSDS